MTQKPLRVLVAEDEPAHAEAIRRALRSSPSPTEIEVVRTLAEYRDAVSARSPDLALLDLNLPDGRAVDVLSAPPELGRFPALIMTSHGDEQIAVEAMRAGALDYVVKSPEAFAAMPRSVSRALREWSLLCARRHADQRAAHLTSVLRGIRGVNQLIATANDPLELLHDACQRLVATMGYAAAVVSTQTAASRLEVAAQAGLDRAQATHLAGELSDLARSLGLDAAATRLSERLTASRLDAPGDDATAEPPPALGVLVASLQYRHRAYGVMLVALPEQYRRDVEERQLFQELVDDLSTALYRLELEAEHIAAVNNLARSEARYRALVDNTEALVFSCDLTGRLRYVSDAAERHYGLKSEAVLGQGLEALIHPEDRGLLTEFGERTLAGDPGPYELRILDGGGRVCYLRATVRARSEAGRETEISGVAIDVSELHHAIAALQLSASRWQATFDTIADMVCVVDDDDRIVSINRAGQQILGLPATQLIGRPFGDALRSAQLSAGSGAPSSASLRDPATATRYEQGPRAYDLHTWPITSPPGGLHGVVHVLKDVTAEVEARRERETLGRQLQAAQRLEAIGRLAGGVAHDFNNFLSVILSYASFARDALHESDPIRGDLVEIEQAAQRAATITRQLLAFGRRQLMEPIVLDLNGILVDIESMLRRLLGEQIEITVELSPDLGSVLVDPGQLEQVVMNLALNARDAMPAGGRLRIETANVELDAAFVESHVGARPGPFVMLAVSDTGVGMDAAIRELVFEPFFTTKERGKGTGLGLATVYGIVKQSGGSVWVTSEPGRGARFEVFLPRVDQRSSELRRRAPPEVATGSETILLVEDEDAVRRLAERILRSAGYHVLTAASAGDALLIGERHLEAVELLLSDVVMPQMSGPELAHRLRRTKPHLRLLFMSGYADTALAAAPPLVGSERATAPTGEAPTSEAPTNSRDPGLPLVAKPFTVAELLSRVRRALDDEGPASSRAPAPPHPLGGR